MSAFEWGEKQTGAAIALAGGDTQAEAADKAGVSERTIRRWLAIPEFAEEVDRLTFLTGIAHKAERLRLAKRVIKSLGETTERDLLEWLKYAQSETDGIKLDFAELYAAVAANGGAMADSGSRGADRPTPAPTKRTGSG